MAMKVTRDVCVCVVCVISPTIIIRKIIISLLDLMEYYLRY